MENEEPASSSSIDRPHTPSDKFVTDVVSRRAVLIDDVGLPLARLLMYFAIMFVYTISVGAIFMALEGPTAEAQAKAKYAELLAQNFTTTQIRYLQSEFHLAPSYADSPTAWTTLSSQYFVATMLATIGYGDMVPATSGGRWFAFFSGLLGIPLTAELLLASGRLFVQVTFGLHLLLYGLCLNVEFKKGKYQARVEGIVHDLKGLQRPINFRDLHGILRDLKDDGNDVRWLEVCLLHEAADVDRSGTLVLPQVRNALLSSAQKLIMLEQQSDPTALLYVSCMLAGWIIIGIFGFMWLEALTLSHAWWFCFVTLATIGYGDVSPKSVAGRLFWLVFIYIGFGLMAWVLQAISHFVGRGTKRVVSGHLQLSLHYDWQATSAGSCRWWSHLKLFEPTLLAVSYAFLGGLLLLELDDSALQPTSPKVKNLLSDATLTPSQQAWLYSRLYTPTEGWDIYDSIRLAVSSIGTVGYGDLVPCTPGGRLALLVYSLLGIGLLVVLMSRQAEIACRYITKLYDAIGPYIGLRKQQWDEELFEEHVETLLQQVDGIQLVMADEALAIVEANIANAHADIPILRKLMARAETENGMLDSDQLMAILAHWLLKEMRWMAVIRFILNATAFIALSLMFAGLFAASEHWTYGDGLWFTFVTTATIGFGDLVPESKATSCILNVALILINLGFLVNCIKAAAPVFHSTILQARAFVFRHRAMASTWIPKKRPDPQLLTNNSELSAT